VIDRQYERTKWIVCYRVLAVLVEQRLQHTIVKNHEQLLEAVRNPERKKLLKTARGIGAWLLAESRSERKRGMTFSNFFLVFSFPSGRRPKAPSRMGAE